MNSLDYIKNQRGLGFIKEGMKVESSREDKILIGTIQGGNSSGNLDILFDGEIEPINCHPTYAMKYFDDNGKLIAEYEE